MQQNSLLKSICVLVVVLFTCSSSFGQNKYLLDSVIKVSFFAPTFSTITHEKNFYNSNDQLVRQNTESHVAYFKYEGQTITEERFTYDSDPILFHKNITSLNKDGFEIKRRSLKLKNDIWITSKLDSIIRDSQNRTIKAYYYELSTPLPLSFLYLDEVSSFSYDESGNLKEKETDLYNTYDGSIDLKREQKFEYNDNNLLILHNQTFTYTYQSELTELAYSFQFYYKNDKLDYELRTIPQNDILTFTKIDYTYNGPYTTTNYTTITDTSEVRFRTDYSRNSTSTFFEHDSIRAYNIILQDTILSSAISNTEVANIPRDSIEINQLVRNFNPITGGFSHFHVNRSYYIQKKDHYSGPPLGSIFVFPNPNTIGSNLIINADTPPFNKLVIYNSTGQLVYEKNVEDALQLVLPNPIQTRGIYFVRVQFDDKPISDWQKLIVH